MLALLAALSLAISAVSTNALALTINRDDRLRYDIDATCFTSGSRGSAESTGIIGSDGPDAPGIGECYEDISPFVFWTLRDKVLFISGKGETVGGGDFGQYIGPFDNNEHIETILIGRDVVRVQRGLFKALPNLKTVVVMSCGTIADGCVVDCPKVDTIIVGANMKDDDFQTEQDEWVDPANAANGIACTQTLDEHGEVQTTYVTPARGYTLSSLCGDLRAMAPQVKSALADVAVSGDLESELPRSLGGIYGSEPGTKSAILRPTVGSLYGITVSDWARDTVMQAVRLRIMPHAVLYRPNYETFDPEDHALYNLPADYSQPITRTQFCRLAYNIYYEITDKPLIRSVTFTDSASVAVRKMAGLGVVNGYSDGTFRPNDTLTRAQAAAIVSRLAAALDKPMPEGSPAFTDVPAGHWAEKSIAACYGAGIMQGTSASTFRPDDPYTVEQSAAVIMRLYDYARQ